MTLCLLQVNRVLSKHDQNFFFSSEHIAICKHIHLLSKLLEENLFCYTEIDYCSNLKKKIKEQPQTRPSVPAVKLTAGNCNAEGPMSVRQTLLGTSGNVLCLYCTMAPILYCWIYAYFSGVTCKSKTSTFSCINAWHEESYWWCDRHKKQPLSHHIDSFCSQRM